MVRAGPTTAGRRSAAWWSLVGWLWLYVLWPSSVNASSAAVPVSTVPASVAYEPHGTAAEAAPPAPYRAQVHRPKKPSESRQVPDAVKHFRFNAPLSLAAADDTAEHEPRVADLSLAPVVIAVTLDGHVHALKRDSGQWMWTLHDDGGAALSGVTQRERLERLKAGEALGGHLVKGASRKAAVAARRRAAKASNGTAEYGIAVPDSADDVDDDLLDEELYIVEPAGGGDIYLYARDDMGEFSLQKLPLSMQELVGQSPFSFPSLSSRIFVGKKDAKFVGVDMRNGRLVGVFGADAGWCEWDVQREASIKSEADYEDDISRRPEDLLYIAKTGELFETLLHGRDG
ncbi:bifunctional endoribonuclease/protein kinase ire1 [Microbotryomycetes sp. JL201]|nr:bifunctional endoribonuclease/protein kinase ire1 [Microbotryomycetes sp. JL201]